MRAGTELHARGGPRAQAEAQTFRSGGPGAQPPVTVAHLAHGLPIEASYRAGRRKGGRGSSCSLPHLDGLQGVGGNVMESGSKPFARRGLGDGASFWGWLAEGGR